MSTQSTNTKHTRQRRYVAGSSRGTHSATTLLAQVANIERGSRIRERREALHLTQPAVVDLLEEAANKLPATHDLHPDKAGKAPVTLRGYQSYEQGGGIVWEKAKLLAQVLQMDVQAMMNGETDEPAPSPFTDKTDDARVLELLESVQQLVLNQNELLARQSAILDRIEEAVTRDGEVRDEIADLIQLRGRELVEGRPPAGETDPAQGRQRPAGAKSSRAAKPRTR